MLAATLHLIFITETGIHLYSDFKSRIYTLMLHKMKNLEMPIFVILSLNSDINTRVESILRKLPLKHVIHLNMILDYVSYFLFLMYIIFYDYITVAVVFL